MRHLSGSAATATVSVAVFVAMADIVYAQATTIPSRDYGHYHGHGMTWGGDHMGGFGMFFGPFFLILVVIAIVAAVIILMRSFGVAGMSNPPAQSSQAENKALDILKERFAKGEIDAKEFDERKRFLSD